MSTKSLAQHAHEPTTREDRWRAIKERTTRGLMAFNRGDVLRLEGNLWAVRASEGGFYRVDLATETCTCPDFEHRAEPMDVNCKHVFAVAIAHATRRGPRPRRIRSGRSAKCSGCGLRFDPSTMVELHEDNHDNLTYFDGDTLCLGCADGAGVEW